MANSRIAASNESPIESQSKKMRMKFKPWLMGNIGLFPGLEWINKEKQIFKVPWPHFGKSNDYDKKYAELFR